MKILIIDTSNIEYIYLALANNKSFKENKIIAKFEQQEKLLLSLLDFLDSENTKLEDISGMITVIGPGSFSALRIGLAVANTIAYVKKIKIVGLSKNDFKNPKELLSKGQTKLEKIESIKLVIPEYGTEPNITKK